MPAKIAFRIILLGILVGMIGVQFFIIDNPNKTLGTIIGFTGIAIELYGIFRLAKP